MKLRFALIKKKNLLTAACTMKKAWGENAAWTIAFKSDFTIYATHGKHSCGEPWNTNITTCAPVCW